MYALSRTKKTGCKSQTVNQRQIPHGSALPQPVRTVPNFLAALHRHILGLFSVHVSWLGYPRFIPLPASFGSLSGLILQWFWNVAPSLQWRDRAGFVPASILASRVVDRKEHRIIDEIVTAMPRLLFLFRHTSFSVGQYSYFT